jgi:hypothetical protein
MPDRLAIQFNYGDGMEKREWFGGEIDYVFLKIIV